MRIVALILLVLLTSACSMNTIETANTIRVLGSLSKAGVNEEAANCIKDIFDPNNRGSGCN